MIKPVAWFFQHEETGVVHIVDCQQVEWGFEKNNPRLQKIGPLYAIPETHRIVPVELLERCSREFQSMEGTELAYPEHAAAVQCYHELRAIIDKEPT